MTQRHHCFQVRTPNGLQAKIHGDPNMRPATREALAELVDAAAKRGCPHCGSKDDPIDICDRCDQQFGNLCNDDKNGYNCTCQHCGNNTYTTRCLDCDQPLTIEEFGSL
jgi:anaerobic ribonucleoside-triphosphate reductase